jgi:hypothetical protein
MALKMGDFGGPVPVSYWFALWSRESPAVSFGPMTSQWELRSTLPVPSCLLYNPKFPASLLLCLPPPFMLVSCSTYSNLKMEAIHSSVGLVDFQQTTQHYNPEDSTLHNDRCENLKSYFTTFFILSKNYKNL